MAAYGMREALPELVKKGNLEESSVWSSNYSQTGGGETSFGGH